VEPEIIEVLIVLAITLIFFASEILAVDVIAVLVLLYLVVPWPWSFEGESLLEIGKALKGFGHPAVIGVGALFIVSEGLLRTGALGFLSNHLHKWSRGSNRLLTALMLLIVLVASAFLNNTPVVAMFIPVVLGACLRSGMNPSTILIPLSYAAILGGTCTLIGTSTNILVASIVGVSVEDGGPGIELGMWDFTQLGVILAAIGFVYLLTVAPRLLPERQTITSLASLGGDRRHREYITEIEVRGGDLIGQRFGDSMLATAGKVRILQIIRGEEIIWPPLEDEKLQLGDALVISGAIEDLMKVQEEQGVASLSEIVSETQGSATQRESQLAELLVLPSSHYVGQLLGSVDEQSANLPGRFNRWETALFRRTWLAAARDAMRALAACVARVTIISPHSLWSCSHCSSIGLTAPSTCTLISGLFSLSLVCPWNCGSLIKTESNPVTPSRMSSEESLRPRLWRA
jgi:hypothetical protein